MNFTNKDTKDLFHHAKVRFPDGSKNNPLFLEVGGVLMQTIFFPYERDIISFGLFFPQQLFSRKTIMVDKHGVVSEDLIGVVPNFALTEHEPDFKEVNNLEITELVRRELKKNIQ